MKNITPAIISTGRFLAAKGWAPATAGNYSVRLQHEAYDIVTNKQGGFRDEIAITQSGKWKGELTEADIMTVDMNAQPISPGKPSDETLLHTTIYKLFPDAGAILHTHSVPCTTLTLTQRAAEVTLENYELLKAFPGVTTHATKMRLPVLENNQDMKPLAAHLESLYQPGHGLAPAFLLRGHGLYAWAGDMNGAKKLVEAIEFMLSCELEKLKIRSTTS